MAMHEQLVRVREKLQQLLKQHHNALKEIQQLTRENQGLKKQLEEGKLQTSRLNTKVDALQISTITTSAESKKELEQRINGYLKEIDKCLNLLKT